MAFETFNVYKKARSRGRVFGEDDEYSLCGTADIFITVRNGNNHKDNNIHIVEHDHTGLTKSNIAFEKNMYIERGGRRFDVQYIVPTKRYNQWLLKEVT